MKRLLFGLLFLCTVPVLASTPTLKADMAAPHKLYMDMAAPHKLYQEKKVVPRTKSPSKVKTQPVLEACPKMSEQMACGGRGNV